MIPPPYMLREKVINNASSVHKIITAHDPTLSIALSSLFASICVILLGIFFIAMCCVCRNRRQERRDSITAQFGARSAIEEREVEEVLIPTDRNFLDESKESFEGIQ